MLYPNRWTLVVCLFVIHSVTSHKFNPWVSDIFHMNCQSSPREVNHVTLEWKNYKLDDVEDTPEEKAKVIFYDPEEEKDVELKEIGQILTPTNVQNQPKIEWPATDGQYYAVLMMDPDAPSRINPIKREWYHFGVLNVQGNDLNTGDVITEYMGAGPPNGSGLHRYVILVYQQQGKIDTSTIPKIGFTNTDRAGRKARTIARNLNLRQPVAGACFEAEWDKYVTKLYKKFS